MDFGTTYKGETIRPASYQLVPLTKLLANGIGSVLIADGVGVGKTISAAYVACYVNALGKKPTFVVSPPSLIPKWIEELRTKFSIASFPIRSREDLLTAKDETAHLANRAPPVYILSNSIIMNVREEDVPPQSAIIFDEIHGYRNHQTESFSAAIKLSRMAEFRIGLTATPINNSLDDLVSEMNLLMPRFAWDSIHAATYESWSHDRERITIPLTTRFTKDKLGTHFAQRKVSMNAISYPPSYVDSVLRTLSTRFGESERQSIYERITYFRMSASSPYAIRNAIGEGIERVEPDPKLTRLSHILDSDRNRQWLVFCEFEDTAEYLEQNLTTWNTFKLTGSTPMFDRPGIIGAFRSTPGSVLIMTSVGSEGLDLQFCNGMVNYDIHWNPMRLEQRIGRIDRLGQSKDEIDVFNIVVFGSIDERVLRVIKRKLELTERSVFATGEIIGDTKGGSRHSGNSRAMYDERILDHEVSETKGLVEALRNGEKLSSKDYDILPLVQVEFCSPRRLVEAAMESPRKPIWVKEGRRSSSWFSAIARNSESLTRLVEYYS